jgi:hypothetical protein
MISSCANPACRVVFDYRHGNFFRFHKAHRAQEQPPNTHSVQHFWLCGQCACQYTLSYNEKDGVLLQNRDESITSFDERRFIAAA